MRRLIISLLFLFPSIAFSQLTFPTHRSNYSASGGGIARVNQNVSQGFVTSGTFSSSISWSVTPANFFVVQANLDTGGSGTITGVTAYAGATPYVMTLAADANANFEEISLYYLPNTAAITSITVFYSGANGAATTAFAAEYSGLSTSATIYSPALTSTAGIFTTTAWTMPSAYTVPSGALFLSGVVTRYDISPVWAAGIGFTLVESSGNGTYTAAMMEEALNTTVGSLTGNGTASTAAGSGINYNTYGVAFK